MNSISTGARTFAAFSAVAKLAQLLYVAPQGGPPRMRSSFALPFALPLCRRRLADLELKPTLRAAEDGPFVTDNFNVILDCAVGPIDDPAGLERAIRAIPGVIDTGLFLGTADTVMVAEGASVRELVRRSST